MFIFIRNEVALRFYITNRLTGPILLLFCNILDFAALNAYVLHEKLKLDSAMVGKRTLFQKNWGKVSDI